MLLFHLVLWTKNYCSYSHWKTPTYQRWHSFTLSGEKFWFDGCSTTGKKKLKKSMRWNQTLHIFQSMKSLMTRSLVSMTHKPNDQNCKIFVASTQQEWCLQTVVLAHDVGSMKIITLTSPLSTTEPLPVPQTCSEPTMPAVWTVLWQDMAHTDVLVQNVHKPK